MTKKTNKINPLHEVKKIDWSKSTFETKNHTYTILKEIPLSRFIEMQKRQPEFVFGLNWEGMIKIFSDVKDALNGMDIVKAGYIVTEAENSIVKAQEGSIRYDATMIIATIFLLREDEDVKGFSKELSTEKIQDWLEEGFSYTDFFSLVASILPHFYKTFNAISQSISEGLMRQPMSIINDLMEQETKKNDTTE